MIVIHAIWDHLQSGELHLWAESSSPLGSTAQRHGKQTERQHPFTLPYESLKEAISELAGVAANIRIPLPARIEAAEVTGAMGNRIVDPRPLNLPVKLDLLVD